MASDEEVEFTCLARHGFEKVVQAPTPAAQAPHATVPQDAPKIAGVASVAEGRQAQEGYLQFSTEPQVFAAALSAAQRVHTPIPRSAWVHCLPDTIVDDAFIKTLPKLGEGAPNVLVPDLAMLEEEPEELPAEDE